MITATVSGGQLYILKVTLSLVTLHSCNLIWLPSQDDVSPDSDLFADCAVSSTHIDLVIGRSIDSHLRLTCSKNLIVVSHDIVSLSYTFQSACRRVALVLNGKKVFRFFRRALAESWYGCHCPWLARLAKCGLMYSSSSCCRSKWVTSGGSREPTVKPRASGTRSPWLRNTSYQAWHPGLSRRLDSLRDTSLRTNTYIVGCILAVQASPEAVV